MEDPFVSSSTQPAPRESHRYSPFDTQLFNLNASSPAQAKRALEAHLVETGRRLEEMSKLGTALVDQQRQLEEQLKEVEQQQNDGEMGPELRQKLADLEREYTEIGRETARAFLAPKRPGGASDEAQPATPSIDQKSPLNPALFASLASNSPSKVSVPSRKQRNQPSNRVHDIEFATEISTSLLAQVRQLQALLAEREETLKSTNLEKSRLELEAEGYAQRIRALDDSEQRYKDENWALETQTHELMNTIKDATEREERLNSSLSTAKSERNAVERELEELKHANTKLLEDHSVAQKATDAELHLLRRNLNSGDLEKSALQKKLQELTSQNQELAKVVAMRIRQFESQGTRDLPEDDNGEEQEDNTPDNSPPVSPNKFTPRHGHLESETLKSSLGHAHRMIQNLKSTIHREKTEKIELKRMLQDARDEVEQRRRETAAPNAGGSKRLKKKEDSIRKPARPDLLGAGRKEQSFVELHDTDWEDNAGQHSPTRVMGMTRERSGTESSIEPSSAYATAAEDGFETSNERETTTESEEFQTGLESMADDSSDSADLTETEHTFQRTSRPRIPSAFTMAKAGDRSSFISSASTSDDEAQSAGYSPSSQFVSRPRVRPKRSGIIRRIRPSGEALMASTSRPTSARSSPAPSFEQDAAGQSLFAELAELEDGDDTEVASDASTPRMLPASDSRRPSDFMLNMHKRIMVDSGMMTDPWEPTAASSLSDVPTTPKRDVVVDAKSLDVDGDTLNNVPTPPKMAWDRSMEYQQSEAGTQADATELSVAHVSCQESAPSAPKWPELNVSYLEGRETVPVKYERARPELDVSSISSQITNPIMATKPEPEPLEVSMISTQHTAPIMARVPELEPTESPQLTLSSLLVHHTEPVHPRFTEPGPIEFPHLAMSSLLMHHTEPVHPRFTEPGPIEFPQLTMSSLLMHHTEPVHPHSTEPEPEIVRELSHMTLSSIFTHHATSPLQARFPEPELKEIPEFGLSSLSSQQTEPVTPHLPEPVIAVEPVREVPQLAFSSVFTHSTAPVAPVEPVREVPQLAFSSVFTHSTAPVAPVEPVREVPQLAFSSLLTRSTEPVVPVEPVRELPQLAFSSLSTRSTEPVAPVEPVREVPQLAFSSLLTRSTEPVVPVQPVRELPQLAFSSLSARSTEPVVPVAPVRELPQLALSSLLTRSTEPVVPVQPVRELPQLAFSSLSTRSTEPVVPVEPVRELPQLAFSSLSTRSTEPVVPVEPVRELPQLAFSSLSTRSTEPVVPVEPVRELPQLAFSSLSTRSTEPVVPVEPVRELPQLAFSSLSTRSTEPVVPVEPVRELPQLAFSSLSTRSTEPVVPVQPVRELPQLAFSSITTHSTQPAAPVVREVPQLAFSTLFTHDTEPIQARPYVPKPVVVREVAIHEFGMSSVASQQTAPKAVERRPIEIPTFSSLHFVETLPTASLPRAIPSMHEFSTQTDETASGDIVVFEDETKDLNGSQNDDNLTKTGLALSDISGNALPQSAMQQSSTINFDHGSQTILSSKQIDQILINRDSSHPISSREAAGAVVTPKVWPASFRRPESATSRASSSSAHPPLPADHREIISAAEKKSLDVAPSSPMGPPMAPASSYRYAPRTPNEQHLGAASIRTMSTQPHLQRRSHSNMSRRSSVSSFASEVEERFNPHAGAVPNAYGPNTDPRMIQAITQTMIGEFLWKYTRRTASNEKMSSTRHRRYFWVHPYTRTLYWSDQDPQTAGKHELKTKSVPIEAVRVVADDNPFPPGLHCRSLEVQSPGRRVRFTASTSQRHETWYNALQYLLVRDHEDKCVEPEHNVTLDDIDEFNPGFRSSSRQSQGARMSLSSYNSRTVRQSRKTQHRAASAMSIHSNATSGTPGRASPAFSSPGLKSSLQVPEDHTRSSSRLSTIFNSSIRGSIASMKGRHGSSVQSDSVRGQDSIEDLAREAEEEDRLENVRACCDGKHDVGSLSHRSSRFSPRMERHHHHH
ncbi:hypothetical protein N7495_000948 [Penicillium taxi]|uniref:uncharacterized protein n=1 Tax=Penicillium taxi TaxID=168475 RepID=UPI002544F6BF|nr:uncharacterized protein N7495_000948 [Penicillium taxi]KAJ5908266.1 hypothetical protein N7495_000948 [Penicillium taxi]